MKDEKKLLRAIRRMIIAFIVGLVLSGLTAFPLETELTLLYNCTRSLPIDNVFTLWIDRVYFGVMETSEKFPFMAYGTDWLAFAHLVIAVVFIGPLRDPVRNIWVIEFGLIACVSVFPLALIAGSMRGIPVYWQLIDCSFGFFGALLLLPCYRKIKTLERLKHESAS